MGPTLYTLDNINSSIFGYTIGPTLYTLDNINSSIFGYNLTYNISKIPAGN